MAKFQDQNSKLLSLDNKMKKYETWSLPLSFTNLIGEGTFAYVYKYRYNKFDAAVKVFKKEVPKKKLLETVSNLVDLHHENIVNFLVFSQRPCALLFDYCFSTLECDGEIKTIHSLRELPNIFNYREYFELEEHMDYCRQIVLGLQYLHQHGIIHKDIKPDNILVDGKIESIIL